MTRELRAVLGRPVDPASLAWFRIAFGSLLLWDVVRFFQEGWISEYYREPAFHFTYLGFRWVRPWPGAGMAIHFALLGALAVGMILGWRSRACSALFGLGFLYVFLLEKARYLNHFYLVILLCGLVAVVPCHHIFAVDGRKQPTTAAPSWAVWLLRVQMGLVYFYAGVAKLNEDWLRAQPLLEWFARRTEGPSWLGLLPEQAWLAWFCSYAGLGLDLLAFPLLCWKRTRLAMFAALVLFHLTNSMIFGIGIFPWMSIAATTVFLEPSWPRRVFGLASFQPTGPAPIAPRPLRVVLATYLALQVLVPLRHFVYPGSVHWTEEGHRFSWHMMLRSKTSRGRFHASDPETGQEWMIDPRDELPSWQHHKMFDRPDMVLEYARHLADRFRAAGYPSIEIRATVHCSLNSRPEQPLIDPDADLARQPGGLGRSSWILPLSKP